MRLLIVTEDKVSESQGGVQRVTYSLSKFFEKNSIAVINAYLKQGDELNEDNDGRYSSFSLSGYHKRDFNRLISKLKVDIIINQVGFDVQALRFLKQSGVPIVSCLHSTPNYQIIEAELYIASLAVNAVNLKLYLRRPYLFSKRLA